MKTKINIKGIVLSSILGIILLFSYKPTVPFSEYYKTYSNEDCLTANIYFEAKGESLRGKKAVATVVYNRHYKYLRENPYGSSNLCSVIFKHRQFSWTHQQSKEAIRKALEGDTGGLRKKDRQAYIDSRMIARLPYKDLKKDLSRDVLFYHSVKVKPYWAYKLKEYKVINNHVFYSSK